MSDLDALLAGIVAHPHEAVRWLIVADWLDDHGFADRAELLRLHRMLIDTCCEPDQHPERAAWQARIVELIDQGVKPCVPQHTLMLPGGVPLVGSFIPPGSFLMGGVGADDEKPVHKVTITTGFFISVYPTIPEQWSAVTGTGAEWNSFLGPVEAVTWDDASAFCARAAELVGLPVRLPTEAEWEYACRAGTTSRYHYGDRASRKRMNCSGMGEIDIDGDWYDAPWTSSIVCDYAPNPWWLFDCHGNVAEWCADWYEQGYYSNSPAVNPYCQESRSIDRVQRGGSWTRSPADCQSARRGMSPPDSRSDGVGFRVVFTLT